MEHKQLTWPQRGALWLRLGIRLGLTALAVWLAARFGRPLLSLFAPFLLALIAAAALNPLVKKLQRLLGWNRQVLTLLLLFLIFGLLGGGWPCWSTPPPDSWYLWFRTGAACWTASRR